ncbi:SanA/YdcF family protein [Haloferula sp.]|uniref:SanA/YdcF family protein n=1 Tax=Haloferula sp. TaxID=2497595 RepID=UPI003C723356
MKTPGRGKKFLKRLALTLFTLVCLGVAFIVWANVAAVLAGAGKLYDDPSRLPDGGVMLVFGCDDRIDGRENLYFRYRIDAAAEVWKAGKARCVIVSGDNRTKYYNEPKRMRQALIEKGIPADKIICDYAGLRTLDSVVRAKEIFGVENVIFISQRFQNERASYLAKAKGFESYSGFNAKDVEGQGGLKTRLREIGARVKMWLDVRVLDTQPRHFGEKVPLPE